MSGRVGPLRQNGRMLDAKTSQLVADYGVEAKAKLAGTGEPEEALRVPIEHLITAIGDFVDKKTILDGELITRDELAAAGVKWPETRDDRKPRRKVAADTLDIFGDSAH